MNEESIFRLIKENRLSKISDEQLKILMERENISNSLSGNMEKDLEKLRQIGKLMNRYKILQKKEDTILKNVCK